MNDKHQKLNWLVDCTDLYPWVCYFLCNLISWKKLYSLSQTTDLYGLECVTVLKQQRQHACHMETMQTIFHCGLKIETTPCFYSIFPRIDKIKIWYLFSIHRFQILNKETTVFNLQNMFRHSHVIFSCKCSALTVVHLNFRIKVCYKIML